MAKTTEPSRAAKQGDTKAADLIATLHDDPQECARIARLSYVSPADPA